MYDTCGQGTPSRKHEALRDIIALKGKGAKITGIRMATPTHDHYQSTPFVFDLALQVENQYQVVRRGQYHIHAPVLCIF